MNEKNLKYYFIGTVLVVILFAGYFIWQSGRVLDGTSGVEPINRELELTREELRESVERIGILEEQLQRSEAGINNSQYRIGESINRIEKIEAGIDSVENKLGESRQIVDSSKSILERIRERGQADTKPIN